MEELTEAPVQRRNKITERIPWTDMTRVVIIGGGFAGIELVRKLSKQKVQIVMVDKHKWLADGEKEGSGQLVRRRLVGVQFVRPDDGLTQ